MFNFQEKICEENIPGTKVKLLLVYETKKFQISSQSW